MTGSPSTFFCKNAPIDSISFFVFLYILMGLFDFFKKKETAPEAQEALDKGLEKTKMSFEGYLTALKNYFVIIL